MEANEENQVDEGNIDDEIRQLTTTSKRCIFEYKKFGWQMTLAFSVWFLIMSMFLILFGLMLGSNGTGILWFGMIIAIVCLALILCRMIIYREGNSWNVIRKAYIESSENFQYLQDEIEDDHKISKRILIKARKDYDVLVISCHEDKKVFLLYESGACVELTTDNLLGYEISNNSSIVENSTSKSKTSGNAMKSLAGGALFGLGGAIAGAAGGRKTKTETTTTSSENCYDLTLFIKTNSEHGLVQINFITKALSKKTALYKAYFALITEVCGELDLILK